MLPVVLNLGLAALKFVGGSLSGSVSVTADALNNLTDSLTALLTILGLKAASMLGGKKHENGHGRLEWIVAVIVSCAVVLVGWETLRSAIAVIRTPESTVFRWFTLGALLISVGVKIFLYCYYTKKSREKNSQALKAAAADCISDAVSTSVVTVSLLVDTLFHIQLDGWCGLLVALFIIYNGVKSFADTAHRIMGGNSDPEQTERLRSYVLAFHGGVFCDAPELQLHDYGYDRYGVSLCVTARQDTDSLDAAKYAAALKSAIYKDFGYSAVIQAELPADAEETLLVQHKVRMAMRQLPFKAEAEQIRVNQSDGNTQVILIAKLPFDSGKNEAEAASALMALLPEDKYDIIVKLRMGRSEQMSGDRRLRCTEDNKESAGKEPSFCDTAYPVLQDDLLERFGMQDGAAVFIRAQALYSQLLKETAPYKSAAVQIHLRAKLFPLMACYQALPESGISREDALRFVRDESQKAAEQKKRDAQRMAKMAGAYSMFRLFAKSHMKKNFPNEAFGLKWNTCDGHEVSFDMTRCIYAEMCAKHGCPELCTVFCENDDIAFAGYLPKIRFERSETIGVGAKKCDFHFVNGAKQRP